MRTQKLLHPAFFLMLMVGGLLGLAESASEPVPLMAGEFMRAMSRANAIRAVDKSTSIDLTDDFSALIRDKENFLVFLRQQNFEHHRNIANHILYEYFKVRGGRLRDYGDNFSTGDEMNFVFALSQDASSKITSVVVNLLYPDAL